jgi:hypothetical protein
MSRGGVMNGERFSILNPIIKDLMEEKGTLIQKQLFIDKRFRRV